MPHQSTLHTWPRGLTRSRAGGGVAALCLLLATSVGAHDDAYLDTLVGPNGGQLRVAGDHHLELVLDPPRESPAALHPVAVFLTDHADQPIASAGFSARAVIVANRERTTLVLEPSEANQLSGTGLFGHDPDMVVVVTLTTPDQLNEQVRFTPYKYLDGSPRDPSGEATATSDPHAHHH
ncbi:hypothetical protein CKO25_02835 [Thiocapsa imhoffii]|uniref:Copper chaperone PCu(A)C n=1 Tax=Thiocapsa imhoffii TaxID=382777 RepID=A0A9X1B793_9GAMM|nr:hypothetical protein [Thiocapsa imhoffii]MBK1643609.1 hypothetical protein [Thiocapsa imhoffii]